MFLFQQLLYANLQSKLILNHFNMYCVQLFETILHTNYDYPSAEPFIDHLDLHTVCLSNACFHTHIINNPTTYSNPASANLY